MDSKSPWTLADAEREIKRARLARRLERIGVLLAFLVVWALPTFSSETSYFLPPGLTWIDSEKDRASNLAVRQPHIITSAIFLVDETGATRGVMNATKGGASIDLFNRHGELAVQVNSIDSDLPGQGPEVTLFKHGYQQKFSLNDLPRRFPEIKQRMQSK